MVVGGGWGVGGGIFCFFENPLPLCSVVTGCLQKTHAYALEKEKKKEKKKTKRKK